MSHSRIYLADANEYMTPNYSPPDIVLSHGKGSYAWDLDGNRYLDFTSGIGVNALGHNHPKIIEAIAKQTTKILHCANQFYHPGYIEICKELAKISFGEQVFLCSTGTEAVEASLKIARRYFAQKGENRTDFVGTTGAFHGRTLGALSVTHPEKYRKGYEPLLPGVRHVPFNDIESLLNAVTPQTAAVIMEPIQGNSGVIPANPEYLIAARQICDQRGALLILDEIQTGIGRTGKWFAYEHSKIKPDILALAKALGGSLPLGAMVTTQEIGQAFSTGVHGTTFGGNPLACAAGIATLGVIKNEELLTNAETLGPYLGYQLRKALKTKSIFEDIRQQGLMIGVALSQPAKPFQHQLRQAGLLITVAGPNTLRILPPLNTNKTEIDEAVQILQNILF